MNKYTIYTYKTFTDYKYKALHHLILHRKHPGHTVELVWVPFDGLGFLLNMLSQTHFFVPTCKLKKIAQQNIFGLHHCLIHQFNQKKIIYTMTETFEV